MSVHAFVTCHMQKVETGEQLVILADTVGCIYTCILISIALDLDIVCLSETFLQDERSINNNYRGIQLVRK